MGPPGADRRIDGAAADLIPDDIVQISLGDVIPADIMLIDGSLLLDQSMLTGESIPVETEPGKTAYAGGLVRRGAAIARVTATGIRTYFGRTAELVSLAHVAEDYLQRDRRFEHPGHGCPEMSRQPHKRMGLFLYDGIRAEFNSLGRGVCRR